MLYQGTPKNKKLLQPQTDNCTTDLNRSIKMSPAPNTATALYPIGVKNTG
jgi:hypothetical protein